MSRDRGIYVEIPIHAPMDRLWELTQVPSLHQRWDLRFTRITYLPRPDPAEPQRFLYETRIGLGLSIQGTGETSSTRESPDGERTSSLRFASDDPKSLIEAGSGYWKYIPSPGGLRFLTWYDYNVRLGPAGQLADVAFRPLIGWATAWSFDRLRLWAEDGQTPESSLALSLIHAVARISIAAIFLWHGLVPKLLFHQLDEQIMLSDAGLPVAVLPWLGALEILFSLFVLLLWRWRPTFIATAILMALATVAVAIRSPVYLKAAFNPVTLNAAVIALSLIGWIAARSLPSASRCLRAPRASQVPQVAQATRQEQP